MKEEKSDSTIRIHLEETYTKKTTKGFVEISNLTHPELEGMTKLEMIDYIKENIYFMQSSKGNFLQTLDQEIENSPVLEEKIYLETIKYNFS